MPNPQGVERQTRRAVVAAGARAATGALLAGPFLAGCAANKVLAQAEQYMRPVPLTVYVLGGKSGGGGGPGGGGGGADLVDFVQPLQVAVDAARRKVSRLGQITFQTGSSDPSQWFPLPSTLFNVASQSQTHEDDPSIPMPDVVICVHSVMPGYLANRALDLSSYVRLAQGPLQGIESQALREGLSYSTGRGTIQASLPVLRNPYMCMVEPGVTAVSGNKAWSVDQFEQALVAMSVKLTNPNAPTPYIPVATIAPMAAIGSGTTLAHTTAQQSRATFGDGVVPSILNRVVDWTRYAATQPFFRERNFAYGFILDDARTLLQSGQPPTFGRGRPATQGVTNLTAWQIVPPPAFAARLALPLGDNIDVMVFRHTQGPTQAAQLALELLSSDVQAGLQTYRRALPLRVQQAEEVLATAASKVQGASLLADPKNDFTVDDWMGGQQADGNTGSWATVQQDLTSALTALTGFRGGYFAFGRFGVGPTSAQVPAAAQVQSTLAAAEAAANSGQPYNPSA